MDLKLLWILLITSLFFIQGWPQTQGCWEQERVALLQLHSVFDVSDWITEKDSNCCHWDYIECHNISGRVKVLTLPPKWRQGDSSWYLDVSLFFPFEELKSLDLSLNGIKDFIDNKVPLSSAFSNLEILKLSFNDFHDGILSKVKSLPNLKILDLRNNTIESLQHLQDMNLEELDLGGNRLKNNDLTYIKGLSIKSLNIGGNLLQGSINIGDGERQLKLINLEKLDLSYNLFNNTLLARLGGLSNLKSLNVGNNLIKGSINIIEELDGLINLEELMLDGSHLNNNILQSIGVLNSLKALSLHDCTYPSENALEGELPSCLANLSSLYHLDISGNQFIGNVFHLSNCTTKELHNEVPNFLYYQYDLRVIDLSYNNFGGKAPLWLLENNTRTEAFLMKGNSFINRDLQFHSRPNSYMSVVDLSENKIQGQIPTNICSIFPQLLGLNLSKNILEGNIPPCLGSLDFDFYLDLSHNQLSGGIPEKLAKCDELVFLGLSNNRLSGKISPTIFSLQKLNFLYLDGNNFDGRLPSIDITIVRLSPLMVMDLSNNSLSGELPRWMSNLSKLVALSLSNNQLEGSIPRDFCHIDGLTIWQYHFALLTGEIPNWVGTLSALRVLHLKANFFTGEIPIELCKLSSLSIIVLSQNNLSGPIPFCLSNLTLEPNDEKSSTRAYLAITSEFIRASYIYKGNILKYMSGIDLSCNRLTGEIPIEIGNLSEIRSLNLSHNNLAGNIPSTFSRLNKIESLDLSHNNLSGIIPIELLELYTLEVFNVSYNNLSGSIPSQKSQFATFDGSSYMANPFLCGPPLPKDCNEPNSPSTTAPNASNDEEESGLMDKYVFQ
ncbi:hypothetical protein V6Z12_A10G252200, partial [Gossypium hirsutum]